MLRSETRHRASVLIQSTWRGWRLRRRWPALRRNLELQHATPGVGSAASRSVNVGGGGAATGSSARPRPQPIAGTPPPDPNEKCDQKMIQKTCTLFGLDLVSE